MYFLLSITIILLAAFPSKARSGAERFLVGHGHLRFFGLTAVLALIFYAAGIAILSPFLGLYPAFASVGEVCVLVFLGGVVCAAASGGRQAAGLAFGATSGGSLAPLSSTVFAVALWGVLVFLSFHDRLRTGAVIDISLPQPWH